MAESENMSMRGGFVDMHHHLVYGLDDGPRKLQNSFDMVDMACQDRLKCVIATPHVYPGMEDFDKAAFLSRIAALEAYAKSEGYDLRILPGAEIYYTNATIEMLNDGSVPTLANTSYVLIEWRTDVSFETMRRNIRSLSNAGYTPIIAHIERYSAMPGHFHDILGLMDEFEMRVQVDCQALYGKTPRKIKRFLKRLLKHDVIDYVGTDAHDIHARSADMLEAYYYIKDRYGIQRARELTGLNQMEILDAPKRR